MSVRGDTGVRETRYPNIVSNDPPPLGSGQEVPSPVHASDILLKSAGLTPEMRNTTRRELIKPVTNPSRQSTQGFRQRLSKKQVSGRGSAPGRETFGGGDRGIMGEKGKRGGERGKRGRCGGEKGDQGGIQRRGRAGRPRGATVTRSPWSQKRVSFDPSAPNRSHLTTRASEWEHRVKRPTILTSFCIQRARGGRGGGAPPAAPSRIGALPS